MNRCSTRPQDGVTMPMHQLVTQLVTMPVVPEDIPGVFFLHLLSMDTFV